MNVLVPKMARLKPRPVECAVSVPDSVVVEAGVLGTTASNMVTVCLVIWIPENVKTVVMTVGFVTRI
jgi:hypothetical protein